jgi:hypothetical protein
MIKATCVSRTRNYLTKQQILSLSLEYEKNVQLNYERIQNISNLTNLNEATIRTWFRNKRYNHELRTQKRFEQYRNNFK